MSFKNTDPWVPRVPVSLEWYGVKLWHWDFTKPKFENHQVRK